MESLIFWGFPFTLQETQSIQNSMNIPKIAFIYCLYLYIKDIEIIYNFRKKVCI